MKFDDGIGIGVLLKGTASWVEENYRESSRIANDPTGNQPSPSP